MPEDNDNEEQFSENNSQSKSSLSDISDVSTSADEIMDVFAILMVEPEDMDPGHLMKLKTFLNHYMLDNKIQIHQIPTQN